MYSSSLVRWGCVLARATESSWNTRSTENSPEILYGEAAMLEIDSDREDAVRARAGMLNVIRELRIGPAWQPYFGVGGGFADVDLHFSDSRVEGSVIQRPRIDIVDDSDRAFAMQLIGGMSVPLTPHLQLAADYRYLRAFDVKLTEVTGAPLITDHSVQSAWLRLRYLLQRQTYDRGRSPLGAASAGYLTAYFGGGFAEDMGLEGELTIDAFDPGPVTMLALGYRFKERWRFELEAGYRKNEIEIIELGPDIGEDAASGTAKFTTLMLNARYHYGRDALVQPFVGLGAGLLRADINADLFGFCSNFVCGTQRRELFVDADDTAAAFQVFAGVDVALTPKLTFTADYRYLVSTEIDMQRPSGARFRGDVRHTSVMVGLRYAFGR